MIGVLETIRVRGGATPLLPRHQARLADACRVLGIGKAPELADVIARAPVGADLALRVVAGAGGAVEVQARAVPEVPVIRLRRARVTHLPYPYKTTDRLVFDLALAEAGAGEEPVLLTREGMVAEGAVTSVFFWDDDVLCTPALDLGILPGVGRARVLELAQERGAEVQVGHYGWAALAARPAFVVNAVRGIVEAMGPGGLGTLRYPPTLALQAAFWG